MVALIVFMLKAVVLIWAVMLAIMAVNACVIRPLVNHWRNQPPPTAWFFADHPGANHQGD